MPASVKPVAATHPCGRGTYTYLNEKVGGGWGRPAPATGKIIVRARACGSCPSRDSNTKARLPQKSGGRRDPAARAGNIREQTHSNQPVDPQTVRSNGEGKLHNLEVLNSCSHYTGPWRLGLPPVPPPPLRKLPATPRCRHLPLRAAVLSPLPERPPGSPDRRWQWEWEW